MARIHGGHTALGTSLNKIHQKTEQIDVGRISRKRGILKKSQNNTYSFYMDILDRQGRVEKTTSNAIPIVGSPDELAMRYGSPQEMEGLWEVLITYTGSSISKGSAQILRRVGTTQGANITETEQSNQLPVKGTAYAPPGSGMI